MSLYRAFAGHGLAAPRFSDQTVFFDFTAFDDSSSAAAHLCQLLAQVWDLPADALEIYNCSSEYELRRDAYNESPSSQWDARLFEIGWSSAHGATYDTEKPPLLLLRPDEAAKLYAIWLALPRPEAA